MEEHGCTTNCRKRSPVRARGPAAGRQALRRLPGQVRGDGLGRRPRERRARQRPQEHVLARGRASPGAGRRGLRSLGRGGCC
eukprot:10871604-Alexandrium_andersonii.AAC.1